MGFNVKKEFEKDPVKEVSGVWTEVTAEDNPDDRAAVCVARYTNAKFQRYVQEQLELFQHMLNKKDEAADKKSDEIQIEGMARFVLMGFKNFEDDDGKPLPHSIRAAAALLKNKDFRDMIVVLSRAESKYKMDRVEDAKNESSPV